jgi:hypothetical protein
VSGGCLAKVDGYTVTAFLKKPLFWDWALQKGIYSELTKVFLGIGCV